MSKDQEKKQFEEKVLFINRTTKVQKGGRRFRFSALILIGNREGVVGFGFAKANEVADAIKKASEAAKKNTFTFEMEQHTIPHDVHVQWDGVKLFMKPAKEGTGIVAGSRVRSVLELAGVRDIVTKNLGCSNPINQVRATIKGLLELQSKKQSMEQRGLAI